jgi:hypothetical protein
VEAVPSADDQNESAIGALSAMASGADRSAGVEIAVRVSGQKAWLVVGEEDHRDEYGPFPVVCQAVITDGLSAKARPGIQVGEYRVERLQRARRIQGSTKENHSSAGKATAYRVTGPRGLKVLVGDVAWADGTRDVRLLDVLGAPALFGQLRDHCRMGVDRHGRTYVAELRKVSAKLNTTSGSIALEQTGLSGLTRIVGEPVGELLKLHGARRVGKKGEVLRATARKNQLCVRFPPSASDVPSIAYVVTRIIPLHRQLLSVAR